MASQEVCIPDIGTTDAVDVIEVCVKPGDKVSKEDPLIILESDKATMEVPAPFAGVVSKVLVSVGQAVKQADAIVVIDSDSAESNTDKAEPKAEPKAESKAESKAEPKAESKAEPKAESKAESKAEFKPEPKAEPVKPDHSESTKVATPAPIADQGDGDASVHAGPAVRRLARELGVNLSRVVSSGPRQRILKEDVHDYVRSRLQAQGEPVAAGSGSGVPLLPEIDFSAFGEIDPQPLSKLKRVVATNLHRSWVHIPHVTQFDHADITDLEAFRKAESERLKSRDVKLTLLAFLVKACAAALREFPRFNASLSNDGESLVFKQYCHIGIAVDTPNGLVVPVIKDADQKSLLEIAALLQQLSAKARDKKLTPADMQGGCFSISSLGGIGGTGFTPIVNWPEVAILGVSRAEIKPVYQAGEFQPRLMLPLSLSYDHRVIDGADAARFTTWLSQQLADIRRLLL